MILTCTAPGYVAGFVSCTWSCRLLQAQPFSHVLFLIGKHRAQRMSDRTGYIWHPVGSRAAQWPRQIKIGTFIRTYHRSTIFRFTFFFNVDFSLQTCLLLIHCLLLHKQGSCKNKLLRFTFLLFSRDERCVVLVVQNVDGTNSFVDKLWKSVSTIYLTIVTNGGINFKFRWNIISFDRNSSSE